MIMTSTDRMRRDYWMQKLRKQIAARVSIRSGSSCPRITLICMLIYWLY